MIVKIVLNLVKNLTEKKFREHNREREMNFDGLSHFPEVILWVPVRRVSQHMISQNSS